PGVPQHARGRLGARPVAQNPCGHLDGLVAGPPLDRRRQRRYVQYGLINDFARSGHDSEAALFSAGIDGDDDLLHPRSLSYHTPTAAPVHAPKKTDPRNKFRGSAYPSRPDSGRSLELQTDAGLHARVVVVVGLVDVALRRTPLAAEREVHAVRDR